MNIDPQETINQLGGYGLGGALVYIGTRKVSHSGDSLHLYVNGKPGWTYVITITLEPSDTYTVGMSGHRGNTTQGLGQAKDVYCDELQATVEAMYDAAMNEYNGGFIPLR